MTATVTVQLTVGELGMLASALDTYEYWDLSDDHQRHNGYSTIKDGEDELVDECRGLQRRIHTLLKEASCKS